MRAGFTDLCVRVGRGAAVDPSPGGRQRDRHPRRRSSDQHPCRRRREALGQDPARLPGGAPAVRPSLRFLGLAVLGWAGLRAATLGALPGAEIFRIDPSEAKPPADRPHAIPADRGNRARRPRISAGRHASGRPILRADATDRRGAATVLLPVYYAVGALPRISVGTTALANALPEPRRQSVVPQSDIRRMAASELCLCIAAAASLRCRARSRQRAGRAQAATRSIAFSSPPGRCSARSRPGLPAPDRWRAAGLSARARRAPG